MPARPLKWPACSAAQFAALCRVTPQTVTHWIDAGMPCKRGRGKGHAVRVDSAEAVPWALARREPGGSQRERLAKEQADKIALENAMKRGELMHADQVAEVFTSLAADLAARHDAVPGRVASEFAGINEPAVIRSRLLDELRIVRAAVADALGRLENAPSDDSDDAGDPDASAEAQRVSVGGRKPRAARGKRRARAVAKR